MIVPKVCWRITCGTCHNPLGQWNDDASESHMESAADAYTTATAAGWLVDQQAGAALCNRECMPPCTCNPDGFRDVGHEQQCPARLVTLPPTAPGSPPAADQVSCIELHCDSCRYILENDDVGSGEHFPGDPAAAAAAAYAAVEGDWTIIGDQAFCTADDCARKAARARDNYYGTDTVLAGQLALDGLDDRAALNTPPRRGLL